MAPGWLNLLKIVPWADVINSAPVVADGAKKLWKSVAKKAPLEAQADARASSGAAVFSDPSDAAENRHSPAPQTTLAQQASELARQNAHAAQEAGRRTEAALAALAAQVAALEQAALQTHEQMLESSRLLSGLAEQNTQLVARAEIQRRRIFWLSGACIVLALLGLGNLGLLLARL